MANRTYQFPAASVVYKEEKSKATGKVMPSLEVMLIDDYGYQREWSLSRRHEPGNSKVVYWESHVYQHPGRREVVRVGESQAKACIAHFLHLCEEYPSLLFNETNPRAPRGAGFVRFCEILHRGALPSKTLL